MNSLRHGMRAAEAAVLPHEDPAEFEAFVEAWVGDLAAESGAEVDVARGIALMRWRLRRIDLIEARRQEAEILLRLEETPEGQLLALVTGTITAVDTMTRALSSRLPESLDELEQLIPPMVAVVRLLMKVEDSGAEIFVGAGGLATSIETLKTLSESAVHPLAYGEVISRAHAAADAVRALRRDVEKDVETVKTQLAMEVPLPGDRDVALRARYRRDTEKRLEAEMRFLLLLRERRAQVQASGSLGGAAWKLRATP